MTNVTEPTGSPKIETNLKAASRQTDLRMSRRRALSLLATGATLACGRRAASAAHESLSPAAVDRIEGLLIGGLIGDSLGGPPEFDSSESTLARLPRTRQWAQDRVVEARDLQRWAETLTLFGYERMRPSTAPYGPWASQGLAGTVTDDSRHKIILMRAVRTVLAQDQALLTRHEIAQQFIRFTPRADRVMTPHEQWLCDEGLREYRFASRWLLGDRDEARALPVERLWGGIANCSGQMMFPPLAAAFAGFPKAAYRATYALDFIDSPGARDICSALNAGLAAALAPAQENNTKTERWQACLAAMRDIDPLRLSKVPFAGRPLHRWLNLADELVERAAGRPRVLFESLEQDGRPVYWWDAHFTLLVPLTILKFCQFNGLAALHLTLDFGHDTDSYAQVLGCLIGAVEGTQAFPAPIRKQVAARLRADFNESIPQWKNLLVKLNQRQRQGLPVCESIA